MKTQQPFPQKTEIDLIAMTLAKMELSPNADIHCLIALAQDIKEDLLSRSQMHSKQEWDFYVEKRLRREI